MWAEALAMAQGMEWTEAPVTVTGWADSPSNAVKIIPTDFKDVFS